MLSCPYPLLVTVFFVLLLPVQPTVSYAHEAPFPADSPDSDWVKDLGEAKGRLIWNYYSSAGAIIGSRGTYADATTGATTATDAVAKQGMQCGPNIVDPIICTGTVLSPPWQYVFHPEVTSSLRVQCEQKQGAQILVRPNNIIGEPLVCARVGGGSLNGMFFEIDKVETCPIPDIPPFGPPDPPALDMTNISPLARRAADCLLSALGIVNLGGAGDAAVFESGYRTLEYQQHFVDLWKKKEELERKADPLCAELEAKINDHFNRHGLGKSKVRPAVGVSCHSSGTCFDVKSAHIPGVDQNAFACGIRRTLPVDDPIHVVPY